MREKLLREEDGFTLPELLVTMMLMVMVLFALYNIFDMSIRVFSFGNDKVEAAANARMGLEKMEREIRAAYPYDKASSNTTLFPAFTPSPSNTIRFGNDLNGDRRINIPDEEIVYKLSSSAPYSLLRVNPSNDPIPDPVVEFVKANGLTFQYLKRDGTTANSEAEIAIVRIKLEVEVKRGPQAGTQTLTTDVALRNRGN